MQKPPKTVGAPSDSLDDILDLVDLDRYPIHDLDRPPGKALVADCRAHVTRHGWCNLDGFIRPEAVDLLASEAHSLLPNAVALTITRNIYGGVPDPNLPEGDPHRREFTHHPLQLADDQIPATSLIKRLYHADAITDFAARVQGKPRLYRYADPFQALNIVALRPGEWHAWHYDHNECTVTLLLEAAEKGGDFTFIPDIRDRPHEEPRIVEAFLNGDRTHARTFGRAAGAFTLFRGEHSLHGVTRVEGGRPRVTAIFTYDEAPGRVSSDEINIRIYGDRVARILAGEPSS